MDFFLSIMRVKAYFVRVKAYSIMRVKAYIMRVDIDNAKKRFIMELIIITIKKNKCQIIFKLLKIIT